MHFEEIINTVSVDDARQYTGSDPTRDSIALFARLVANGHVAWHEFSEETRNRFKKHVEELYQNPPTNNTDLLKELGRTLLRSIPDNHAGIFDTAKRRALSDAEIHALTDAVIEKVPQTHVGSNAAIELPGRNGITQLFLKKYIAKHETPTAQTMAIFEKNQNGQRVGIVALTDCPQPEWFKNGLNDFFNTLETHSKTWDAVIVDVRGNLGGNSEIIERISKHLYGSEPPFITGAFLRRTPEARLFQEQKFNERTVNTIQNSGPANQLFESNLPPQRETNKKEPFKHPVYILTDRKTSSSAEFICGLAAHPKATFVGENTCGCFVYGNVAMTPLPCGGYLKLGVFRFKVNLTEGIGHAPDIKLGNVNALDYTLNLIDKKAARHKQLTQSQGREN